MAAAAARCALGLRPRNNLVDVTNYVTFELGQPSHAYDLNDLQGGELVVRRARAGETLTALNEAELTFSPADLLITTPDGEGKTVPIGVAGVIGGLHHSVKPDTKSVALEVAHFDPVSVRKTAKRLGLSTDAHTRFERGVDPNLPPLAAARAASLLAELGGGTLHPGVSEVGGDITRKTISFRPSRVAFLTTLTVPLAQQKRYLGALGCSVEQAENEWRVTPPSWRFDLFLEDDLVEEVARLYGYEHIGTSVPTLSFIPTGQDTTHRGLRNLLVGLGMQETMTYTFSSDDELRRSRAPAAQVRLASPPSQERSVLRTALYPGLLNAARTNRGEPLALFEVGQVFEGAEEERLALLMRGAWSGGGWLPEQTADFYVFKGVLEKFAATLGAEMRLEPDVTPALHPGVSAAVLWDGVQVGFAGRLHPAIAAEYELGETYLAELTLPLRSRTVNFHEFSRQPFAERDLAVITPKTVLYAELAALVKAAAGSLLSSVQPFDVYEGKPVPEDQRSVALRLRFRDPLRALEGDEVDARMEDVITALAQEGYDIRDR